MRKSRSTRSKETNLAEVETIRVKYYPGSPHFEQTKRGNWIDTYVYEDVIMKAGEFKYIPLGFALELPEGYEGYLLPRSSTFKRWGVLQTNGVGIVDTEYNGDDDQWMFPALATRDVVIPKGTRICQFRIQKSQPQIIFQQVASLGNSDRGGLGSSGA